MVASKLSLQFGRTSMANRLSTITTRTGDDGTTGLGDGSRVAKTNGRVAAMGDVDELNSHVGVLLCEQVPDDIRDALLTIQHDLFDLGGELCIPGFENIAMMQIERLDQWIAHYNEQLPRLAEFILPGGSRAAAQAHIVRTVCRRAERTVIGAKSVETIRPECQQYLNRLSDLMFVLARILNRAAGGTDVLWEKDRKKAGTK
jgi:cob(I)alamin adenosyltransferase